MKVPKLPQQQASNVLRAPPPQVPPAYLAMAAAHMDKLGKLNLQDVQPAQPLGPPSANS